MFIDHVILKQGKISLSELRPFPPPRTQLMVFYFQVNYPCDPTMHKKVSIIEQHLNERHARKTRYVEIRLSIIGHRFAPYCVNKSTKLSDFWPSLAKILLKLEIQQKFSLILRIGSTGSGPLEQIA